MTKEEIKKALYKQKPQAIKTAEDHEFIYYDAYLEDGTEINFEISKEEGLDDDGSLLFKQIEPAQLLIRWLK